MVVFFSFRRRSPLVSGAAPTALGAAGMVCSQSFPCLAPPMAALLTIRSFSRLTLVLWPPSFPLPSPSPSGVRLARLARWVRGVGEPAGRVCAFASSSFLPLCPVSGFLPARVSCASTFGNARSVYARAGSSSLHALVWDNSAGHLQRSLGRHSQTRAARPCGAPFPCSWPSSLVPGAFHDPQGNAI